jgi:hypothetical protein
MTMATDRVNRNNRPLAGNQLAQALRVAGVVAPAYEQEPVRVDANDKFAVDEAIVLPELREWLARLVAGEHVPKREMALSMQDWRKQDVLNRLKAQGLIEVKVGPHGGAMATPKLIEMARTDISDDDLRRRALTDVGADEVSGGSSRDSNRHKFAQDIYAWLLRGARGDELRISHIGRGDGGSAHTAVKRLREAGLVEKFGEGSMTFHVVPKDARSRVQTLTHDELTGILWRRGTGDVAVEPETTSEGDGDGITPELADISARQETAGPPPAIDDPVARIFDQILTVLVRMDARFARLERELSLPPIEQEVAR